jgi:hypothetical protein
MVLSFTAAGRAGTWDTNSPTLMTDAPSGAVDSTRHGLFNALDSRSVYGTFWFPEPLNSDEGDVDNELNFKYSHSEKRDHQADEGRAELEKAFGLLTVEVSAGYESTRDRVSDGAGGFDRETEEGWSNFELAARYPFLQFVSQDGKFDDTFVFGVELAPPANTEVSKDTEIVPKVFNLLKLGEHFSLQTGLGVSTLIGPEDGGASALEYNAVFAYELTHEDLPLPGVVQTFPIFEIDGETPLNHDDRGDTNLEGVVGVRVNFEATKFLPGQPRVGVGYAFPLNNIARDDFHWGIVGSLIFEF